MADLFFTIFTIVTLATLGAFIARFFKQPLIPAYILTGVLLGPAVFNIVADMEVINFFSEVGIAFLLFVVGLEFNLKKLKLIGLSAAISGIMQVLLVSAGSFAAVIYFGFYYTEAVYLALIIAFSSTLVVVKLLSDKKEIDTLHGKMIIGILLVQDAVAIFALPILASLNNLTLPYFVAAAGRVLLIFGIAFALSKLLVPQLFKFAAKSKELFFLLSLSILFLFSMLSINLGLTVAVGGLIAGLTLANLPYNFEIISKVRPLRDFFSTLFFVSIGMGLTSLDMGPMLLPLAVILGLVLVFKPLVTFVILHLAGHTHRTNFTTATSLAQVSEFSMIIAVQGLALGQISEDVLTITVLVSIITIAMSSYFIHYNATMFNKLRKPLRILDKVYKIKNRFGFEDPKKRYDAIIVGCDRIGRIVTEKLRKLKKSVLVVDFNPDIIHNLTQKRVPCIYGDINDVETFERINLKEAKLFISTVPYLEADSYLLRKLRRVNKKAIIFMTSSNIDDAVKLYNNGADYVIMPHILGGEHASFLLDESLKNIKKLIKAKRKHIRELNKKQKLGLQRA